MYEAQIVPYLETFHIPVDYQQRLLDSHRKLELAYCDIEQQRATIEKQLQRAKELYEWGDYSKAEYHARRDELMSQLKALPPTESNAEHLDRLATFLAAVPVAWKAATPEQRNKLAQCLFEEVWLEDKAVVAVKPRPEMDPFFRLNYEDFNKHHIDETGLSRVELYREHRVRVLVAA